MSHLFTKENITFLFAVIGFLGTASGWIYYWITCRKNLFVRVIAFKEKDGKALSYLAFENKSRIPISITSISLLINEVYYPCKYLPQRVMSYQHTIGSKAISTQDYFSVQLPIELCGLGATSGYVLFVLPKGVYMPTSKDLTLRISSNRGKAIERKLSLDQTLDIL